MKLMTELGGGGGGGHLNNEFVRFRRHQLVIHCSSRQREEANLFRG